MTTNSAHKRRRLSRPFAYLNRRNPTPNLVFTHISRNDAICANDCTGRQRYARKNRATRSEPHVVANTDAAAILGGGLILNVSISGDSVIGSDNGAKLRD